MRGEGIVCFGADESGDLNEGDQGVFWGSERVSAFQAFVFLMSSFTWASSASAQAITFRAFSLLTKIRRVSLEMCGTDWGRARRRVCHLRRSRR